MNHPAQHSALEATHLADDALARQTALDTTNSYIVDAPAGAGKTELLTQRFLALLARVDEPEEVVALTFTRKAAAEMRDRIMASLRAATQPVSDDTPPHKKETHQLALGVLKQNNLREWQLLDQPGRLRVMTLDALSMSLARQMPLLTRFGTQPGLSTECQPLYAQAARDTLALLESSRDISVQDTVARVLAYFDNDAGRLQNMLISMLERRDQWQRYTGLGQSDDIQETVTEVLRQLIQVELLDIASHLNPVFTAEIKTAARHAANNSPDSPIHLLADWDKDLPSEAKSLPQWRALAELFLTADNKIRKDYRTPINLAGKEHKEQKQTLKDALSALEAARLGPTLTRIRELPDPDLGDDEAAIVKDLAQLLHLAYGNLWLTFGQEKTVDHTEIARRALMALGNDEAPTDLAQQLDYQIRHLLVDEFQDTSPTQIELLERLMASWSPDAGQTLFLVGDPMQSIYRFRKADVGLFLRVRERGIGPIHPLPLRLYQNNRSNKNVVDWVNHTFQQVFAERDDATRGAVSFKPAVARKPHLENAGVSIHPLIRGDRDPENDEDSPNTLIDQREARIIVDLIRQTREEQPEGTIAILVRARSHLNGLVSLLQNETPRIAFQAVEIDALAARQPIQDLAALTRAMHHQGDRVHWLAILRAPWCGLRLEDLHQLAADDHAQTLWSLMQDEARIKRLSDEGQLRLQRFKQILSEAYAARSLQRPGRWIEGIWRALNGPLCLKTTNDVTDVQAFFTLLDKLDHHGALDLSRLDDGLSRLFAAPDAAPDSTHVQLMTVHKSKGLQFDTVILPGLHKRLPPDDKALIIWDTVLLDDDHEHLVVAPIPPAGAPQSTTPTAYDLLRNLEKTRSLNEAQRILYVAATRAERRLHLLGVAARDTKSENSAALKAPAPTSRLAPLWPALESAFANAALLPAPAMPKPSLINPETFVSQLVRLRQNNLAECLPIAPTEHEKNSEAIQSHAHSESTIDMAIGTLTHLYLEIIAQDGLNLWSAARIADLFPTIKDWFSNEGFDLPACTLGAQAVHDALIGALHSQDGQWVLGSHTAAGCEVPMSNQATETLNEFSHHVIDRTFIDEGCRWIIDYKTINAKNPGALTEQLLIDTAHGYKPQLERYAALFADEGLPIRLGIFFPTHGKLIKL